MLLCVVRDFDDIGIDPDFPSLLPAVLCARIDHAFRPAQHVLQWLRGGLQQPTPMAAATADNPRRIARGPPFCTRQSTSSLRSTPRRALVTRRHCWQRPSVRNWDAHRGMRMATSDDVYPLWHAWIPGCLPGCEYKFAILKRSGEVEWEQSNNRRLAPLTNRVAAIFGVAREVTRTRASDAALFATRHAAEPPQRPPPVRVQLPHASVQVPPVTRPSNAAAAAAVAAAAVATAAKAATNSAPEWPKPHPAPPRSVPPPLALDASFVPFVPVIGGASADSTPCNSRPVSRTASHSSLRRNGSSLSGSRVSFSKNLVDLADAAGRSVPVK